MLASTMPDFFDHDRFASAATRFRDFFAELGESFIEREDVLVQFQLALLCREHVLMTGPPGTAKSQMAAAVLRRVIDEGTGQPSVFARQFTENTVQTDLVGPIDFKTLMESGRTEHFTDEGILGAVHAFLDEVFDGRDMLLRSTLNLLHERELKQGTMTTRGRIESAFMTSNRYIAEILESARETLLAFLDRVAFVSFVPRGFANRDHFALVVRRHGGGFGRHRLSASLSIQDLDVLQHAVERTFLPEAMCDGLASLLTELDAEQAAAMRADREFQPTRYLSTRTAIRAAGVLRAAAVLEQIRGRHRPPFMARWEDMAYLRYNLVLSGLSRERVAALLEHETDPRERRQLEIMRTEAEIFERCLAKVEHRPLPDAPPSADMSQIESLLGRARESRDAKQLVQAAQALVRVSESGVGGADIAARKLAETVGLLSERALAAGLSPQLAAGIADDASGDQAIAAIIESLASAADALEAAADESRPLVRWVRGRLLELIDEWLKLAPAVTPESVEVLLEHPHREKLVPRIDQLLAAAENLYRVRHQLELGGAWLDDVATSNAVWQMALAKLERELGLLWDVRFRLTTTDLLAMAATRPLSQVLTQLGPQLEALRTDSARLSRIGLASESELGRRVLGPRIEPLVSNALQRMQVRERMQVVTEVEAVVRELDRAGLADLIDASRFVEWTAPALIEAELAASERATADADQVTGMASYRDARDGEDPLSLVQTLVEIALRVVPHADLEPEHPELATRAVWSVVRDIRPETARQLVELDLERVERGVRRLQSWWAHLSHTRDDARADADQAVDLLEQAVRTGFLRVMRSPDTLRLAVEAKTLADVFPAHADRANGLRKRLRQLDQESTGLMVELLEDHSERAWSAALDQDSGS